MSCEKDKNPILMSWWELGRYLTVTGESTGNGKYQPVK